MDARLPPKNSAPNIPCVDLVRSLAIFMVMAKHLKPTLPLPAPVFRWGWDHFQIRGSEGVAVFFVVSGFLITRIIDLAPGGILRPDWKYFYIRRVARIVPLFLLQVALGLLLVAVFADGSKKFIYCFKLPDPGGRAGFWLSLFSFSYNWANVLFQRAWNGVGEHWAIFWSLAIEEQFYLFYPFFLKLLGNIRRITGFLLLVVLASFSGGFLLEKMGLEPSIDAQGYIISYGQIASGALLYLLVRQWGAAFFRRRWLSWALVAAGLGLLGVVFASDAGWTGRFLIAPGTFLFLLGGIHLPFFRSGGWKWFLAPGKYSYGNYLFHTAVLFFIHSFLWNLNIVLAFALFISASTALSAFSYRFFEVPANHFVRRMLGAKA